MNYVHRVALKRALGLPASVTSSGINEQLDDVAAGVSRLIDQHCGFTFGPVTGTRDFTARETNDLHLGTPLLAVDALRTSSDNGSSYGTTLTTADYWLAPYNATMETPKRPFWEIRGRATSTGVFPVNVQRGTRVVGAWGYYDERKTSTGTLATAINATLDTFEINGGSALYPGQTLLMGTERMFVLRAQDSATGSHTSTITVQRGVDGTSATTHSCATAIDYYTYPVVDRLALHQAQFDYRAQDAPLGFSGGGFESANQRPVMIGGLHPFVRRRLDDLFRKPTVG